MPATTPATPRSVAATAAVVTGEAHGERCGDGKAVEMSTTTTTSTDGPVAGRRSAGARSVYIVGIGMLATVLGAPAVSAPAAAAPAVAAPAQECAGPEVLLVHDLAGTPADWSLLSGDLRAAGWCPVAHSWGTPRPGDVPLPVGGLTGVEAAAAELVRERGWGGSSAADAGATTGDRIPVVAKGVGGLVVQRALQLSAPGTPPVSELVTLGPVWNGTNLLWIADMEDVSRRLGAFDTILAWERTWMDPLCEGCREAVRGSDVLSTLHRDGIRTPGVDYTDIATVTDLLVQPPLQQSPKQQSPLEQSPLGQSPVGVDLRVVSSPPGAIPVWHGELGRDNGSRALVLAALGEK